jgi:hypothetical protein
MCTASCPNQESASEHCCCTDSELFTKQTKRPPLYALHTEAKEACGASWPAVLRLALHGGKVSIFFSINGFQIGGQDLQNRTS